MKPEPAVKKIKRSCTLRSTIVRTRVLVIFPSFREVLGIDATPDDPDTITKREAIERSGLSRSTIDRMIAAGRAESEAE